MLGFLRRNGTISGCPGGTGLGKGGGGVLGIAGGASGVPGRAGAVGAATPPSFKGAVGKNWS